MVTQAMGYTGGGLKVGYTDFIGRDQESPYVQSYTGPGDYGTNNTNLTY